MDDDRQPIYRSYQEAMMAQMLEKFDKAVERFYQTLELFDKKLGAEPSKQSEQDHNQGESK